MARTRARKPTHKRKREKSPRPKDFIEYPEVQWKYQGAISGALLDSKPLPLSEVLQVSTSHLYFVVFFGPSSEYVFLRK